MNTLLGCVLIGLAITIVMPHSETMREYIREHGELHCFLYSWIGNSVAVYFLILGASFLGE